MNTNPNRQPEGLGISESLRGIIGLVGRLVLKACSTKK